MFENKENERQFNVVYCGIVIFFTSAIFYILLMLAFGFLWKTEYLLGVVAYGFFLCLQNLYGYLARAYGKNLLFIFTGIISTACNAALNILLLVVLGWDYRALYVSFSTGIMVQCIILEMNLQLIKSFRRKYLDKDTMICLLRFSLPLCVNSLCYWLLTGYNRIIIEKEIDSSANGYYAVACKFGGILLLVSSCFSMAWQELAYSKYGKDKDTGRFYSYATELYIKVLFCGFFVMTPLIYLIFPYLVDEGYEAAKQMIPVNMLATLSGILFIFLANIISTYKKNNIVFLSTLAASIVNMTILHLLIKQIGAEAANIALLAGYVVSDGIRICIIRKEIDYHLKWNIFGYLLPFTAVILLGFWKGQKADNIVLIFVSIIVSLWILWSDIEPLILKVRDKLRRG